MLKRVLAGMAIVLAIAASPARADVVLFSDNFNTENAGVGALNYSGFQNFSVADGTVDLIGNGFFDFPPVTTGHGLYVDLDGSTANSGLMLADPITLNAGDYELFFQLAGNQRVDTRDVVGIRLYLDGVEFRAGNILLMGYTQPFIGYPMPFTLATAGEFSFAIFTDSIDNIGPLLDNISLTGPAQVPEPASLLLLGTALAFGAARRFRS